MENKKREKPKHLGRGLESLLGPIKYDVIDSNQGLQLQELAPNFPPDKELRESLQEININTISPNPHQARTVWNEQELAELAESIKANGVIQPIIVRPFGKKSEISLGKT
jgi:ParB family chromosome partitioning protein